MGLKPNGDQIDALIKHMDTNNNGLIEFLELVSLIAPGVTTEVSNNQEQLMELFLSFDRDNNGYITAAELARSMAKMGHTLFLNVGKMLGLLQLFGHYLHLSCCV